MDASIRLKSNHQKEKMCLMACVCYTCQSQANGQNDTFCRETIQYFDNSLNDKILITLAYSQPLVLN